MPSSHYLRSVLRLHLANTPTTSLRYFCCSSQLRNVGPAVQDAKGIETMLAKPSWSVKALFVSKEDAPSTLNSANHEKLHHLLRLSALPLPESSAEEVRMLKDLESQLRFVRTIQKVDTTGVEPLMSIRDETEEGLEEQAVTRDTLRADLEKEMVVGMRRRIMRKPDVQGERDAAENWDPFASAPHTKGRFIALETRRV